jgi:hypothetical protein
MRTLQRAAVAVCLGLGAIGGINALASGCSTTSAITAAQMAATLNRAAAVDGFAQAYLLTYLSGAGSTGALAAYTSAHVDPSPVPAAVIATAPWSHARTDSGFGNVDYWSVVIGAFVKPAGRPPQLRHYQVPIAVIDGQPRAVSAPALVNGPGAGYDAELGYPEQLPAGNAFADTVSGFMAAWLAGAGDLQRYADSPDIRPFTPAPFARVAVAGIAADTAIPAAPPDGFTARILVSATAQDSATAATSLTYPLSVAFRGGKWFITGIDLAPRLGGRITPVTATATSASDPALAWPTR